MRLGQRELALAAVALLAGAVALAVMARTQDEESSLPEPKGAYVALAAPMSDAVFGRRTACGQVMEEGTQGIAHPVLPCGARIYVGFRDKHVLTQVIDRGPSVAGRQLELSPALAELLGVDAVRRVSWSYAAAE